MNILPFLTAIVAAAFTYMLARQYMERKKFHQLLWTFRMLFYAITAFMEFLMNPGILGPSVIAFKVHSRAYSSMSPISSSSTATGSSRRERRSSPKPGRSGESSSVT